MELAEGDSFEFTGFSDPPSGRPELPSGASHQYYSTIGRGSIVAWDLGAETLFVRCPAGDTEKSKQALMVRSAAAAVPKPAHNGLRMRSELPRFFKVKVKASMSPRQQRMLSARVRCVQPRDVVMRPQCSEISARM